MVNVSCDFTWDATGKFLIVKRTKEKEKDVKLQFVCHVGLLVLVEETEFC